MTRTLAWVVLALALGAAAAYYLRAQNGYVLASYGPWVLETSVLGFLAFVGAVLLALYVAGRALGLLFRLPQAVRSVLGARREKQAQDSFEGGVQKLIEGHWARAEAELVRRAADHGASGLNYLLAARAAQRVGAPERRDRYLELAASGGEDAAISARIVRAQLMLEADDAAAALATLEPLRTSGGENPHVLELLARALARLQKWQDLRALLETAEGSRALPQKRYEELYGRALAEGLREAAAQGRLDSLKALWNATPAGLRGEPRLRAEYLRGLARLGADREVAALIPPLLAQGWDPQLVDIYGELGGLDATTQLAAVEQWLNQHGEQAETLLAAGRVCLRNQLWGKARAYLDVAARLRPGADVYLALAKLCELTRNPEEALLFYKRGLELAVQPSAGQVSKA